MPTIGHEDVEEGGTLFSRVTPTVEASKKDTATAQRRVRGGREGCRLQTKRSE